MENINEKYIKATRTLHKMRRVVSISSYAADLYHTLLDRRYASGWPAELELPTKEVESMMEIARPTICKAREELKAIRLIAFENGVNGSQATRYRFLDEI